MTPERWQQIKGILAGALEQPNESSRVSYLRATCRDDTTLQREVESLLDQPADDFDSAADVIGFVNSDAFATTNTGRRVGAYELLRELGELDEAGGGVAGHGEVVPLSVVDGLVEVDAAGVADVDADVAGGVEGAPVDVVAGAGLFDAGDGGGLLVGVAADLRGLDPGVHTAGGAQDGGEVGGKLDGGLVGLVEVPVTTEAEGGGPTRPGVTQAGSVVPTRVPLLVPAESGAAVAVPAPSSNG